MSAYNDKASVAKLAEPNPEFAAVCSSKHMTNLYVHMVVVHESDSSP